MGGSPVWVGEPELLLGHSGHKLFPAAERRRERTGAVTIEEGKERKRKRGLCDFFFFVEVSPV